MDSQSRETATQTATVKSRWQPPASPTRGVGAARQWIFDELKRSSAKLQVSFDTYQVAPQERITRSVELRNVVAILPGRTARRVYISGHYDSAVHGIGWLGAARLIRTAVRTLLVSQWSARTVFGSLGFREDLLR